MAIRRHYVNNAPVTTLSAGISAGATTCVPTVVVGFPSAFPWTAVIDAGTATAEIVLVTAAVGSTLTITRAYGGTAAQSHAIGAVFSHVAIDADYDESNLHVTSTSGVHGVAGALVGTSDVQTLTNKTLTAPTINGAALSGTLSGTHTESGNVTFSAAGTGVAVTNNATVGGTLGVTGAATFSGAVTANGAGTGLAVANNATVAGTMAVTGGHTAASYSANNNGVVTGVVVPRSYATEAAATAAIVVPATGAVVWLTAPATVGAVAGLFEYTGAAWVAVVPIRGACKTTSTSVASITSGTATAVGWNATPILDNSALFTSTGSGVTVLRAGTYLVSGVVAVAGNATGRRGVNVLVNTVADSFAQSLIPAGVATALRVPLHATLLTLNANDIVTLAFFQDSGVSLALSGLAEMSITKIA